MQKMIILILILGIFFDQIYTNSNFNQDYPNVKFCVIPDHHTATVDVYTYLQRQLSLHQNCTHIRGSLFILNLRRYENGSDPDLSFLESIVEISGALKISETNVRRIPLGNLKIVRGITLEDEKYSVMISHNNKVNGHYLEEVDLHSLRAIMSKDVRINNNHGLGYLTNKVDWKQIILNPSEQKVILHEFQNNETYPCHASCNYWNDTSNNERKFCFGPRAKDCQQRSKCLANKGFIWCRFTKHEESVCDNECVGGCYGNRPKDCVACSGAYKKDQCVSSCAPKPGTLLGNYDNKFSEDKLIYTTGGLCTSKCPGSLLDQEKVCVYQCNFRKYYKSGNRCLECPNLDCYTKEGDNQLCDLGKVTNNVKSRRKKPINRAALEQLTNCTMLLGQLAIEEESFKSITIPMLYRHLKNVREVIGDIYIFLPNTPMKNLTFLSNLREIRGTASLNTFNPGLKVFVSSLEFLGLKKLEKVQGIVNFNYESKLCYDDTIPWSEITAHDVSFPKCNKKCHSLCNNSCWGPGNDMCYKCHHVEAGEFCVKNCSDVLGYYNDYSSTKVTCRKCHPLCKSKCTGPLARDCTDCRFSKENGICVDVCSRSHYMVKSDIDGQNVCKPCHTSCYVGEALKAQNLTSACTGPSNMVGNGGCSMCHKILRIDNVTRCHKGVCPGGFFEGRIKEPQDPLIVSFDSSCEACDPLCKECSESGTDRKSCKQCKGFWSQDNCVKNCPGGVKNVSRELKVGDNCPTCHSECKDGCLFENDNSKCIKCVNKKLIHDGYSSQFSCVSHCPAERNYTDYRDEGFVCLNYAETGFYIQRKRITYVVIGSLACFGITLIIIVLLFRCKSRQSKIKAELKAFYSNFNEPIMKSIKADSGYRQPNMNRLQMIPISDLIFNTTAAPLGAGAFGKVYRGYWKVPGSDGKIYNLDVVVKVMHNSSKSSTNEFLEEAQIMASVSHRHCLPLIGVCLSLEKPCLVSTFAEFGSLEKYLHQNSSKISSYSLLKWSVQIADGMAYLNMVGIIHRDLAARNILVSHKNIVQITDFGLARLVDNTDDGIVVRSGRVPIRWLALETLLYANYSTASDIWAYGVTLWEIFTFGKRPYEDIETSKVKVYLQEGNRLFQPDICTLEVYMAMIKCWLEDPQMRPSFTELMETFEQFSFNSKRYLCIPGEHANEYSTSLDSNKESICLNKISTNFENRPLSNKSDDTNWTNSLQNDSAYQLINHSFSKEEPEDHAILPRRKKPKTSFQKLKNIPKFGLNKMLPSKSRDSKAAQYYTSNSYDSNKHLTLSYESTTALISHQKSNDSDHQPVNQPITKILKKENRCSNQPNKNHNLSLTQHPERKFNDKEMGEEPSINKLKSTELKVLNRSPSLPPINVFRFVSKEPSVPHSSAEIETKVSEHSPDSGNSQDFEIDDYLLPSRVQSLGYYNLTPSPSTNMKPTMDLGESLPIDQSKDFSKTTDDDGYMEPTSKATR